METSSCPGWWVLHGAGTSLSQMEQATKLGEGLKALDRLEQTLGLGLVGRARTPEILAACSQEPTFHRGRGATPRADHVPRPSLTLFPGWAQRSRDPAAATDEKPQPLQRSQHGNTSSSSQHSRAAGDAQNRSWERRWEEEERRRILV